MANRGASTTNLVRVQTFVTPEHAAALDREAKLRRASRSQAASDAIARGLSGRLPADPDDRLLQLERRLSDHMRLTARDLRIIEELVFSQMRLLFTRLPETAEDRDPVRQASVEARLQRVLDEVAGRIVAGPRRPPPTVTGPSAAESAPQSDASSEAA